jgi:hypothetical protein
MGSTSVPEMTRGRKRDRSTSRTTVQSARAEESSTLRGRSRQRALSPMDAPSRSHSPSLMTPTTYLLLTNRLRHARKREHCPSRATSSTRRSGALQTGRPSRRSPSRGPRSEYETHRTSESTSSLRHELLVDGDSSNMAGHETTDTR